jgi:hypothetical protein
MSVKKRPKQDLILFIKLTTSLSRFLELTSSTHSFDLTILYSMEAKVQFSIFLEQGNFGMLGSPTGVHIRNNSY